MPSSPAKTARGLEIATADELLAWYDRHARRLPWRVVPEDRRLGVLPDPYQVWLSEIMLQQTTVATVRSYFEKFVSLWPTIHDMATTSRERILSEWAGLGYYSRARNLKACADQIVSNHNGVFPTHPDELIKLPGIGAYTSAAISAIAFDHPSTVVDGNVERVLSRLFQVETPLPKAKKEIHQLAQGLTPQLRAGDYAQAIMDLGATICTPKKPACALCPWQTSCAARTYGDPLAYPKKMPKAAKPKRYGFAYVAVREDGAVLLRERPDKGLLGGMTEVPGSVWQEGSLPSDAFAAAPISATWHTRCGTISHTFTHFHLELSIVKNVFPQDQHAPDGARWVLPKDFSDQALPTVMRKVLKQALP